MTEAIMTEEQQYALAAACMPWIVEPIMRLRTTPLRFAHYTSAEVAMSILKNSTVWLRNARVMNDFSEVRFGHDCIDRAWRMHRQNLNTILGKLGDGIQEDIAQQYNTGLHYRVRSSYLVSMSVHEEEDDQYGRLSMWRAYGGPTNVAIVLNPSRQMTTQTNSLGAWTFPVIYPRNGEEKSLLDRLAESLSRNLELLSAIPRDALVQMIMTGLGLLSLALKHPGFMEEREWRIIAPHEGTQGVLRRTLKCVNGVPQTVLEMPIRDIPGHLDDFNIPSILDRIIIGPTQDPDVIYEALVAQMEEVGVVNARQKVMFSNIPLRR